MDSDIIMDVTEDYTDRLRPVFDLCDSEKQGYISVGHFISLAKDHFGANEEGSEESLTGIIKVLDPEGDGRIHFNEFCQGVRQILDLKSPSSPTAFGGPTNGRLFNLGSEETLVAREEDSNSCGTHETSEISTYNEYDMMTDDDAVVTNGHINGHYGASPPDNLTIPRPIINSEDDRDSAFSGRSSETQDHRGEHEVTDEEEKYEDYGAAEEESETDSPANKRRDKNSLHVHSGAEWESPSRKSRRKDWLRPSRRSNGSNRTVTSRAFASQLYRSGSSAGASRRSSCSDEIFDDIDGSFVELNDKLQCGVDKLSLSQTYTAHLQLGAQRSLSDSHDAYGSSLQVKRLEAQIHLLTENQVKGDERTTRLKEENSMLVERVHLLEEQLREVEVKAQERLKEEQRQHREMLMRTDKEKSTEIEILSQSLQHIEREYQSLKEEAPRLRTENDRLKREKQVLEDKIQSLQNQLMSLHDEHTEVQERLQAEKQDMVQERQVNAQLIEELSKELDELRSFRMEAERGRSLNSSQDVPRSQRKELEARIQQLYQENVRLKDQNEELQAQLLSNHVQEGRSLLMNGSTSLADEIENLPKDELMKALKEQQDVNAKLRSYVDRMTLRILEKNPSLLEIGSPK